MPSHRRSRAYTRRELLAGAGGLVAAASLTLLAREGSFSAIKVPAPPVTLGPGNGPTGPGYVRFEDLYQPGDTISQAWARLGSTSISYRNGCTPNSDGTAYITHPDGVFLCRDFYGVPGNTKAQYALYLPHNCLGLIGSGAGVLGSTNSGTIFMIEEDSSTVPMIPQSSSGGSHRLVPNSCQLMYHGTGSRAGAAYRYENFQIIGTPQQNTYNGLGITNPAGPVAVRNVLGFGGVCNSGSPPGETFLLGLSGGNGPHVYENVATDGNNTGGGVTMENTLDAVWRNVSAARSNTHPLVLFQAFGTRTYDCALGPPSSASTVHGGQPTFNHERTSGTVHTRLTMTGVKPNLDDNIIHSNDTYRATIDGTTCSSVNGSLTLIDVSGIAPSQGQYLRIESGFPYNTSGFNGDTMTTPPRVLAADGVTHVPYEWLHKTVTVIR